MTIDSASRIGAGVPAGGQFAQRARSEADIALDNLIADRDHYWTNGTVHSRGGYDRMDVDEAGSTVYTRDGDYHRLDGPAVTLVDGTELWYREGVLHRDGDEPAIIASTGEREWYRNGVQHREGDEPAVIEADGSRIWLVDGRLHRGGGKPAVAYNSGQTEWWVDGDRHRAHEYGPAVIRSNGDEQYWEHGRRLTDKEIG